jgi:hypothetical protein
VGVRAGEPAVTAFASRVGSSSGALRANLAESLPKQEARSGDVRAGRFDGHRVEGLAVHERSCYVAKSTGGLHSTTYRYRDIITTGGRAWRSS